MEYLAFDQSMKCSGWSYFKDDNLMDCGKFSINPELPLEERLACFYTKLDALLEETRVTAPRILFEDIQMQMGNVKTYSRLAYIQAILLFWCHNHQLKYAILSPSHWRKVLGGSWGRKREEQKQHAIDFVKERYGIDVDSDTADAICIGYAGIQEQKQEEGGF